MVTIANVASRMLDETRYTAADISLTNLEYLIDNAIDYVNLQAGTSIADLTGAAESKQYIGSEAQTVAMKACVNLLLRAYLEKGPVKSVGGLTVGPITTDPHYKVMSRFLAQAINKLRGRSFERA